jgi:hypothetical protein
MDAIGEIKKYLELGEIPNPRYNDIKFVISREVSDKSFSLNREYDLPDDLLKGGFDLPHSLFEVKVASKRLAKYKGPKDSETYKAVSEFIGFYSPVSEDMDKLKSMVVKAQAQRGTSVAREKEEDFVMVGTLESLTNTTSEYKELYLKEKQKNATGYYTRLYQLMAERLKEATWEQIKKEDRYQYVLYRELENSTLEKLVKRHVESAKNDFERFLVKMAGKIAKPVKATSIEIVSWSEINLSVICLDGEQQEWYMQAICNYSKYGRPFNQFPVRRR